MDKLYHCKIRLAPLTFQRYRSILIELLDALSVAKKEHYEEILSNKISQLDSDGNHLLKFLIIIKDEPLLAFMIFCRLKNLQTSAQIRLLTRMRIFWPKDLKIINRLSHIFFVSELWKNDYGESPFANDHLIPHEALLAFIIYGNKSVSKLLHLLASNKNNNVFKPNYLAIKQILNRALSYRSKMLNFLKSSDSDL